MTDPTDTSGAAARALAARIAPLLGHERLRVSQAMRQGRGDFRVESEDLDAPSLRRLRDAIRTLPGVARAEAGAHACHVTLDPAALADAVVTGVLADPGYGAAPRTGRRTVVTFSDPNLNKPLHLGHLRNNLLGMSVAALIDNDGDDTAPQVMHSDWGVHICQALAGYLRGDPDATPESTGRKSDHFVGAQYVRFYEQRAAERAALAGDERSAADREAYDLLVRIENGDERLGALARRLTEWAEQGVRATYARIGTRPRAILSERDCLPLARGAIEDYCRTGRCAVRADGSVYADLRAEGLDELTLFRQDGTALVYTQWLGVDLRREADHEFDRVIQVSGREWELGEVLYTALRRHLGYDWIDKWRIIHYGMVLRAGGKMKSRTGDAVRIDTLLDETVASLLARTPDLAAETAEALALGGVKTFFLGVPRKNDIDFDEQALARDGLATFATVVDLVHRGGADPVGPGGGTAGPELVRLLLKLDDFPRVARCAAHLLEPARVVSYVRELAALAVRQRRALDREPGVAAATAHVLVRALGLLGIDMPAPSDALAPGELAYAGSSA